MIPGFLAHFCEKLLGSWILHACCYLCNAHDEIRGMLRSGSSAQWMGAGKWKVKIEGVLSLDTPTTSYHICGVQQGKGHDTKFRKTLAWLRGIGGAETNTRQNKNRGRDHTPWGGGKGERINISQHIVESWNYCTDTWITWRIHQDIYRKFIIIVQLETYEDHLNMSLTVPRTGSNLRTNSFPTSDKFVFAQKHFLRT